MTSGQEIGITGLAEAAGVPIRTVRFYITSRLLPSPEGRGRGASYTEEHLDRLRLIRTLTEKRVPLADIRATVAPLSGTEVKKLLERERRKVETESTASRTSPREYVTALLDRARVPRSSPPADIRSPLTARELLKPEEAASRWRRIELGPGLELHVRADREADYRRILERMAPLVATERKDTE